MSIAAFRHVSMKYPRPTVSKREGYRGSEKIPKQLYMWICDAALMKRNRSLKYIQKSPPGWDYPQTVILHRS